MSGLFLREVSSGKLYEVNKEIMKIGRSSDAEISMAAPSISRHHATIYLKNNGLIVEDAGSQNGVRVNKKAITVATSLKMGDRIEMGGIELEVSDGNPSSSASARLSSQARVERAPEFNENVRPSGSKSNRKNQDVDSNKRMMQITIAAVVVIGAYFLMPADNAIRNPAGEGPLAPLSQDELTKALNSDSYAKGNHIPKTPTEVESESRFRQAMRDYYDGNYSRAIVVLKQALVANPSHEAANEYLQFAESRLNNQIDALMKSGQRSYSVLQYSRARSEFSQVLSILSEQIPGYWQRISSDLNAQESDRRPAQEEVLLQIPCEKTKRKDSCKLSVDMIRLCRKLLGEEDVLK